VAGGMLVDASGRRVTLSGLSLGSIRDLKAHGQWGEAYFEKAAEWCAKLVRMPVNPPSYKTNPELTLADLDDAARWCEKLGLYLVVDYHIIGNVPEDLFLYGHFNGSTWEALHDFWEVVGARFADNPTVAFAEIYNEPAAVAHLGGQWAPEDWKTQADEIIAILREHAPEMIPLVGGLNYAYDFSWFEDHPLEDENIALAVHPYPDQNFGERVAIVTSFLPDMPR
jgi:endoglucanase